MNRRTHRDIVTGKDRSASAQFLRLSLRLSAFFYGLGVSLRNRAFNRGWAKIAKLPHPVVSLGNLTAGGTGKTPHVIWVVGQLRAMGLRPAVLLRGYVPTHARTPDDQGSDETLLLQQALGPDVPVQPNPDRIQGAQQVLAKHPEVNVFVLDDGFQHRRAHRDLDLLLVDATSPFGLGRLLPAGFLREPVRGVRRAHALILTRCQLVPPEKLASLENTLRQLGGPALVAHSQTHWTGLLDAQDGRHDLAILRDQKLAAVCGIGNPAQFKAMLANHFSQVVGQYELEDHQAYNPRLVRQIVDHAVANGATALVMTEKDWVKWQPASKGVILPLPVYRLVLEVRFTQGHQAVVELLRQRCVRE